MFEINAQLMEKLRELARAYTPEWQFSEENPDSGSVTAMLFLGMLSESMGRMERVLHKHRIEYLNLFDRFKEEPIECARSYVQFYPVSGADGPALVPRGTQLSADSEAGDTILFETTQTLTAVNTAIQSIFVTDGESDRIFCALDGEPAQSCSFTAFDAQDGQTPEHMLVLAYDRLFDDMDSFGANLSIRAASEEQQEHVMDVFDGKQVRFALAAPDDEWIALDAKRDGDSIALSCASQPEKVMMGGRPRYAVAAICDEPMDISLCGAQMLFSGSGLSAQEIWCGGVLQNSGRFLPFGKPMAIYAECGIENREVLARAGARITMSFDLDFELHEQKLPEPPQTAELRIIMKKPVQAQPAPIVEIRADYVVLEYFGAKGWRRLIDDEHAALLFNGSASGRISMTFVCPSDMSDAQEFTWDYRLRLRLARADNLYQIPCRQYCPVISNVRFSYVYSEARSPDYVCTQNHFNVVDVTEQLRARRSIRPFYNSEQKKPCMYFGFDHSPAGTPFSLFFDIENDYAAVDFTAEYLGRDGFTPIQTEDHTCGLLYSETIRMLVSKDAEKKQLFGKECYWLRFALHSERAERYALPRIKGIRPNVARVQNLHTTTEYYYVDRPEAPLHIALGQKNLLQAQVFVNEREAPEQWVLWEKRRSVQDKGRFYSVDLSAGTLDFEKNAFSTYMVRQNEPAIRVELRAYQGSAANVDKGRISTMRSAVRFISSAENFIPAFGGYDGYNEDTSARMISNMLRTRGRAVSERDYFDLISQITFGVRRIKCRLGMDVYGHPAQNTITVAMLIEEYDKGGHIFSAVKESVSRCLMGCSALIPMGTELVLTQPRFVRLSVRLWIQCPRMDGAYELQREMENHIRSFIDPLDGGFEGRGWKIGEMPTIPQLLSYLRLCRADVGVTRLAMTAFFDGKDYAVDDTLYSHIDTPFAIAINGEHVVHIQ